MMILHLGNSQRSCCGRFLLQILIGFPGEISLIIRVLNFVQQRTKKKKQNVNNLPGRFHRDLC